MSMQLQTKAIRNDGGQSLLQKVVSFFAGLSEPFWFVVSFLLFLLMGPFSAIAVLIGLCSLASEEHRNKMSEPARV
jgi:phosphotransferase system  glucose/maltose/N-acetylglucosamine-specific IIC component